MSLLRQTAVSNRLRLFPVRKIRAKQKPVTRGATRRDKAQKQSMNWSGFSGAVRRVMVIMLVLVVAGMVGHGAEWAVEMPVSRVVVNGEFRQVDRQLIVSEVEPFLKAGFLRLDLDGIRQQLRSEPWIFDVTVLRRWPNEIVIAVEEQSVIARWGEDGFLNHRGELFQPRDVDTEGLNIAGLPLLKGPKGSSTEVMSHFRELSDTLSQHGLTIRELGLNEHGSWYATLDNDIDMFLGSGEIMQKVRRFLVAYQSVLASDFYKAKSVDMRYNGGFAVAWRNPVQ